MKQMLALLLALPLALSAQQKDTSFAFYSAFVKDSFKIQISLLKKSATTNTYMGVYVLDGDETFAGSKFALNALPDLNKNVLLVAIGYGATYGQKGNKRDRDYSPIKSDTSPGKKFSDFIAKELVPFLDKKYPPANERVLVGYSAGANFCLYSLLTGQKLFSRYAAGSIGSSLDSAYLFERLGGAKTFNQKTYLFISSGSKEAWATEKMGAVVAALQNLKGNNLAIKQRVFEGQSHGLLGAFLFLKGSYEWLLADSQTP